MSAPTKAEVITALSKLPTLQLRRVFFEGLQNPLWVKPLLAAGAFDHPPAPAVDEKGYVRETFWPEVDYLTRMAIAVPDEVVSVLIRLKASENSWVRRATFEIARSVPVDKAIRLKGLIEEWNPNFGFRTDPHDLTMLATNFLKNGQTRFGISFANMLFRPRPGGSGHRDPVVTLEEYWYTDALPEAVEALGPAALTVVLPWLEKWEELSGHFSATSDFSSIARSDIGRREDHHFGVEQALVEAIRDILVRDISISPTETTKLLLGRPMILIRKIGLHAAAKAVEDAEGLPSREALAAGQRLLEDPLSAVSECRIDFADLFAVLRHHLVPVDPILEGILDAGPLGSRQLLIERLRERNDDGADIERLADEHEERWQQRLLATIGAHHLPEHLADRLRALDERTGAIEGVRTPDFKVQSWTGPTSPSTVDDLKELTPSQLIDHLEGWHPPADNWMSPTHEGMGRVLSELIASKPDALLGVDEITTRLRPTYLRAILQGWDSILRSEEPRELNWSHVIELTDGVLSHPDKTTTPVEGRDFDDDADFTSAKQTAIGLLSDAARQSGKRALPPDVMAQISHLLIEESKTDESSWSRYHAKEPDDGTDPLNASLNWQWAILVRGLVNLISHGPKTSWFTEATSALERELGRDDQIGASRAVIGESLGRLSNGAAEWLNEHLAEFFGTETDLTINQQIALTTALATQHMHPVLFELLRPALAGAMRLAGPLVMGWHGGNSSGPELIGQWIITSIIWGTVATDDPIVEVFFSSSPADVRGAAIGHIAWSFLHSERVDADIRQRFEQLWDARVEHVRAHPEDNAELKDFYWFVRSEKFAPAWWLPRLREAAELNPAMDTRGMIGEQLASFASQAPYDALHALRLLMDRSDETGHSSYDLSQHAAAPVIAVALDAGDSDLARDAMTLMNKLGAGGLVNLDRQVKALRTSAS